MEVLIVGLIGFVLGATVTWFIRGPRKRVSNEIDRLKLAQQEELAQQQEAISSCQLQLVAQKGAYEKEIAQLQSLQEQAKTTQQLLDIAKAQLGDQFKATATDVLQSSNRQFLELSEQNLGKTMAEAKSELDERHRQFQELIRPLAEDYDRLNPRIDQLMQETTRISAETNRLSAALTDNRQVGHWGEVQLRRVVELAGMTSYCDFEEQNTQNGQQDNPQIRPDLVVKLPEGRAIVVDAKASTQAYMEAAQTEDPQQANMAWTRHARALQRQVDELSRKDYGHLVQGSLDFVVMFIPGDQFLAAALRDNPGLVAYAMDKRVVIATPASLIAMLWAVNSGWQRFRLEEDAASIKVAGDEMYKRLQVFIRHYGKVGKELASAVKAYNASIGSFDQRLMPQGRRFAELVVGSNTDLAVPDPVDGTSRQSTYDR